MNNFFYEVVASILKWYEQKYEKTNVLELGCGKKIYKKIFKKNSYYGLDLPSSSWISKKNKPEILKKVSLFTPKLKYKLIYSIASVYLFDEKDLQNLIKIINKTKKIKGMVIIFDYKKNTILNKIGCKYNNYEQILKKEYKYNFKKINLEWCTNIVLVRIIKKILNINISQVVFLNFGETKKFL